MRLPARIPRPTAMALAIAISLVLGVVDYLTGPLFSFTIFYLVPVALVAWYLGRRDAVLISLFCAVIWSLADLENFDKAVPVPIDIWNAAVRIGFFLIVVATLSAVRSGVERENTMSREFQHALLPSEIQGVAGFGVASSYIPTRTLSGDYFDVLPGSDGRLTVCIADVSGKGPGPALLMANLQAAVKVLVRTGAAPAKLCEQLNVLIAANSTSSRFITFFVAAIDPGRGRLVYANAGHSPPLLLRRDGGVLRLTEGGMVLGVEPDRGYEQTEVVVARGDELLLYTDGLTEARNRAGEEFGEKRLVETCLEKPLLNVETLKERVMAAVTRFKWGEFADDVTLLVVSIGDPV